jgi:hypothetical protein
MENRPKYRRSITIPTMSMELMARTTPRRVIKYDPETRGKIAIIAIRAIKGHLSFINEYDS